MYVLTKRESYHFIASRNVNTDFGLFLVLKTRVVIFWLYIVRQLRGRVWEDSGRIFN